MSNGKTCFAMFFVFAQFICVLSYKPVVIIHGLFDDSSSLDYLGSYISKVHPGTNVTIINLFHGLKSLAPLWLQVHQFKNVVVQVMKDNPKGIHMIGYSQGGVITRGIIETTNNHNIHTFVSLSSPQMGQFGDTDILKVWFHGLLKKYAYKFFYTEEGQLISVGNYWHDPHHESMFLNQTVFLPYVNNEVKHNLNQNYKRNFMCLKHLVLIGGPDDGVVSPWQSSQFGFYTKNEDVLTMKNQWVYRTDAFGLKTLDANGAVKIFTRAGINHFQWHRNHTVFDDFILPFFGLKIWDVIIKNDERSPTH